MRFKTESCRGVSPFITANKICAEWLEQALEVLYNKEKQIAKTLQTVLNQTYQDFEIVIVNDGSTDGSVDEVKKFLNPRIRLINQKMGELVLLVILV